MPKVTLTQAVGKMSASLDALVAVNTELVALMRGRLLPNTTAPAATPAPAEKAPKPQAKGYDKKIEAAWWPTVAAEKAAQAAKAEKKAPKAPKAAKPAPIGGFWYLPLSGGSAVPVSVGLPAGDGRRWVLFKGGNWRKVDPRRVYDAKGWLEV